MIRSTVSLASGLGHLFSLGNNPLALSRDVTMCTKVLGDEGMGQSEDGGIDNNLARQAVEQDLELQCYEEDGLCDNIPLVEFCEVGIAIFYEPETFFTHI